MYAVVMFSVSHACTNIYQQKVLALFVVLSTLTDILNSKQIETSRNYRFIVLIRKVDVNGLQN